MVHSPDFFPENSQMFLLRVRLFCMALVGQLGGDSRWSVQPAALWHCYLPLWVYVTFLNLVSIHSFLIFFFNLISIN